MIKYNNIGVNTLIAYGTASHTGSLSNTILHSIRIPANTYKAGDFVSLDGMFSKTGTNNSWTLRYYWVAGATATLSGATQLSLRTIANTNQFATQTRRLQISTADGTGSGFTAGTITAGVQSNLFDDIRSATYSNVAINWTVDSVIFSAVTLASSSDTCINYYIKLWEW